MPPLFPPPAELTVPPKKTLIGRFRRAFRSRKALSGVTQLLIDWGIPVSASVATLLAYTSWPDNWYGSYKVLLGVKSLDSGSIPLSSWLLFLVGWAAIPALVGGLAGHVITARAESAKKLTPDLLFQTKSLGDRLRPPLTITWLGDFFYGSTSDSDFIDTFVRIAHGNDWLTAQDHWELIVRDLMCTKQFGSFDRIKNLKLSESGAKLLLRPPGTLSGICPVCEATG